MPISFYKNMKKYRVSLALKVPSNFEVEVNADTEKEAFGKAQDIYNDGKFDENVFTEPDWNNVELDINKKSKASDIGNGIFIEEVEESA